MSQREPKGAKSEPKGAKGSQKGAKREPKGAKMEPKVSQRAIKMHLRPSEKVTKMEPKGPALLTEMRFFWEPFCIKNPPTLSRACALREIKINV